MTNNDQKDVQGTNLVNYRRRQGRNWFRIFARIIAVLIG